MSLYTGQRNDLHSQAEPVSAEEQSMDQINWFTVRVLFGWHLVIEVSPKSSPAQLSFWNFRLLRFHAAGLTKLIETKYVPDVNPCTVQKKQKKSNLTKLNLNQLSGTFLVLGVGLCASFFVFIIECFVDKYRESKRVSKVHHLRDQFSGNCRRNLSASGRFFVKRRKWRPICRNRSRLTVCKPICLFSCLRFLSDLGKDISCRCRTNNTVIRLRPTAKSINKAKTLDTTW